MKTVETCATIPIFTTFVTTMEMIIYTSIAILNVITFFLYGIDKWKAKKDRWRIPESTLLLLAVLGGSIGAWLGMKTEECYPSCTHTPPCPCCCSAYMEEHETYWVCPVCGAIVDKG